MAEVETYPCANCGEPFPVPMVDDCLCGKCAWQHMVWQGRQSEDRGGFSRRLRIQSDDRPAWLYRTAVPYHPVTYRIEFEGASHAQF